MDSYHNQGHRKPILHFRPVLKALHVDKGFPFSGDTLVLVDTANQHIQQLPTWKDARQFQYTTQRKGKEEEKQKLAVAETTIQKQQKSISNSESKKKEKEEKEVGKEENDNIV